MNPEIAAIRARYLLGPDKHAERDLRRVLELYEVLHDQLLIREAYLRRWVEAYQGKNIYPYHETRLLLDEPFPPSGIPL